jgi:phosphoenolpyruvate carboxylase
MCTLRDLILAVKDSDSNQMLEQVETLMEAWNAFSRYFNIVVDIDKLSTSTTTWTKTTEYLYKRKDEERRLEHNICIAKCEDINHIAEELGLDLCVDISDRHQVACFIGDSLAAFYDYEIQRN